MTASMEGNIASGCDTFRADGITGKRENTPLIKEANEKLQQLIKDPGIVGKPDPWSDWIRGLWVRSLRFEQIARAASQADPAARPDHRGRDMGLTVPTILSTSGPTMLQWIMRDWRAELNDIVEHVTGHKHDVHLVTRDMMDKDSVQSPINHLITAAPLRLIGTGPDDFPARLRSVPDIQKLQGRDWSKRRSRVEFLESVDVMIKETGEYLTVDQIVDLYDDRLDMVEYVLSIMTPQEAQKTLDGLQAEVDRTVERAERLGKTVYLGRQDLIDILMRLPGISPAMKAGRVPARPPGTAPAPRIILQECARWCFVDPEAIKGPKRHRELSNARMLSIYLMRQLGNLTFSRIGEVLGNRDHTSVLSALNGFEGRLRGDAATRSMARLMAHSCDQEGVRAFAERISNARK